MKKIINKKMLFAFAMVIMMTLIDCIGSAPDVGYAKSKSLLSGINIDVSNRYYTVKEIKQYIQLASKGKKGYVQLHFTGDRNVGIECEYLDQIADEQYKKADEEYYNPKTGRSFLTKAQIKEIIAFAKKKKVEVVPEIDMPGHAGGFEKLYVIKHGKTNDKIFNPDYEGELLIESKKAITFVKSIYREYAKLFKGCKYFHIGCDEFWSGNSKQNANYINTIAGYVKKKGFQVFTWNDLFDKANIKRIDRDITVTYWSYDGDTVDNKEKAARRKKRASFPELQKVGFKVINYNSYYLYYTPSPENSNEEDINYAIKDARNNWNLLKWDSDSGRKSSSYKKIRGACVSVWGEDSKGVSKELIRKQVSGLYGVVLKKCNR